MTDVVTEEVVEKVVKEETVDVVLISEMPLISDPAVENTMSESETLSAVCEKYAVVVLVSLLVFQISLVWDVTVV